MKYRVLTKRDLSLYRNDIYSCFNSNKSIYDSQSPYRNNNPVDTLMSHLNNFDTILFGIFDDDESYLYGIILFENVRINTDINSAQVHIIIDKAIWGKVVFGVLKKMADETIFNRIFAEIPAFTAKTVGLLKRLGFKKTGYKPDAVPYIDASGKEKMYDLLTYTLYKKNAKNQNRSN